jgi:hypothetical protein
MGKPGGNQSVALLHHIWGTIPPVLGRHRAEPDAIETISNVQFGQINRAKARIGPDDVAEEAMQGSTKLHGLYGGQRGSVIIDPIESVVGHGSRASITLLNLAQGTKA